MGAQCKGVFLEGLALSGAMEGALKSVLMRGRRDQKLGSTSLFEKKKI